MFIIISIFILLVSTSMADNCSDFIIDQKKIQPYSVTSLDSIVNHRIYDSGTERFYKTYIFDDHFIRNFEGAIDTIPLAYNDEGYVSGDNPLDTFRILTNLDTPLPYSCTISDLGYFCLGESISDTTISYNSESNILLEGNDRFECVNESETCRCTNISRITAHNIYKENSIESYFLYIAGNDINGNYRESFATDNISFHLAQKATPIINISRPITNGKEFNIIGQPAYNNSNIDKILNVIK